MSADEVSRDAELFEILGPYLEAFETGKAPDREEFLARHPEHREQLEACLASLDALHVAGGRGPASLTGETLGDFEVGEEIGRGGMGVVYEARQVSLDRRVALKVLLTPALLEPARLRRFQTEAVAAAHLQHPHIVPVHGVGSEDGIYFYAMQRVEGMTVAQVIGALRGGAEPPLPGPVKALVGDGSVTDRTYVQACARLAKDAAEALEHAHRVGIVHRDVKPANLILDERGHVFVADFGLASFRTEGPGVTLSGDLIGTLRYMSPEQARAAHDTVDHRTDVYSLGVTLYEMLTLERAFPGESAPDLIEAITKEGPRPLRRESRHVPAALETIVAKATAKESNDRYATADDLAADLDRFLGGRPIAACRPSLPRRALGVLLRRRWIVLSGLALVLAGVVLAPLLYDLGFERIRDEAEALHAKAQRRRDDARQLGFRGETEKALVAAGAAADLFAQAHALNPERDWLYRYAMCRKGQAHYLLNLGSPAEALPHVDEALGIWLEMRKGDPDWLLVEFVLSGAHSLRAEILWELRRYGQAEREFEASIRVLEEHRRRWPRRPQLHSSLCWRRYHRGFLLWHSGRRVEAMASFRETLGLCRPGKFHLEDGVHAWILATCPDQTLRDPVRAMELARDALAKEEAIAVSRLILGAALLRAGESEEAVEELTRAWEERAVRNRCGIDHALLTIACVAANRPEEARRWFREGEERGPLRGRSIFAIAEVRALREEAAAALKAAEDRGHEVAELRKRILDEDVGYHGRAKRLDAQAVDGYRNQLALREELRRLLPEDVENQDYIIRCHGRIATSLMNLGRLEEAAPHVETANAITRDLAMRNPGESYRTFMPGQLEARLAWLRGDLDRAVGLYTDLLEAIRGDLETRDHSHQWGRLVFLNRHLGLLFLVKGDRERARACFREALAVSHDSQWVLMNQAWTLARCPFEDLRNFEEALRLAEIVVGQADDWFGPWRALGAARYASGDYAGAKEALEKALKETRRGGGGNGLDWYLMAMACWKLGEKEAARRWFQTGTRLSDVRGLDSQWCDAEVRALREEAVELLK